MKRTRQANSFIILLDSRTRQTGTTVSSPTFNLTKPISNVTTARVRSVQFTNNLFNIDGNHNKIGLVNLQGLEISPGFYSPSQLIQQINESGIGISLTYVSENNTLLWDTGNGVVDVTQSSMAQTLGLQQGSTYTGTFTTTLFLASPMNVDFVCDQLGNSTYSYSGRVRESNIQPLISCPVVVGYGNMNVFIPPVLSTLDIGGTSLSQLNFKIVDSLDGRELKELGHWSMQIEVFS
jgi:hypothetical protein